MIVYKNTNELAGRSRMINVGRWQIVQGIYKGAQLVWQAVSSCFGSGAWINAYQWKNDDGWKNI